MKRGASSLASAGGCSSGSPSRTSRRSSSPPAVSSARRATELAAFVESQPIDEWRGTHAAAGLGDSNDSADHAYFVGMVAGFTPEVILTWIDQPAGERTRFEQSYAALRADEGVAARVVPYVTARAELVAWMRALRRAVGLDQQS